METSKKINRSFIWWSWWKKAPRARETLREERNMETCPFPVEK